MAAPSDTLVLERTGSIGHEFILSFNTGVKEAPIPLSAFGQAFAQELMSRNLTAGVGEPVHLPGLHPVLCHKALESQANVLFLTEILQVRRHPKGYEITFHHSSGIHAITANRIVDTTTKRLSKLNDRYIPTERRLNAYIHADGDNPQLPRPEDPRAKLVQGRFESEQIFKWSLEPQEDWPAARRGLLEYWHSRPASLRPWTLTAIATAFECQVPRGMRRLEADWIWLPSEGYAQPVEAIDQGYSLQWQREG